MGESIAWPGQVPGLQDVLGDAAGRQELTAPGKNLSPKQPGLGDWPSHPILKATVVVESTSYLHGLHRTDRPPSPLPGTQEPREFLQLEQGGEKGLKVPVLEAPDLRAEHREIEI